MSKKPEQNAYEVTVGNIAFYQRLVVLAADQDAAFDLFAAYLAAPEQQAEEYEEYETAVRASIDGIIGGRVPQRADYQYRLHDADVKPFFGSTRTVIAEVQRMSSGGNG